MEINMQTITAVWWGKALLIILFYLLAWLFHRSSGFIATRMIQLRRIGRRQPHIRNERMETLHGLTRSGLTFIGFSVATFFSLLFYISGDTLIWVIGLFSAAFGLGARPFLSDFLTGIAFLFEDTFDVGEKVELSGTSGSIEGVVEAVNMRTTEVRSPTGELITLPNGEIRLVRNYSRGRFSVANIKIKIAAEDVQETINLLTALATEAVTVLPNLLEPWQIISESGEMGQSIELTLVAKARFGKAAEMRPHLLALVQEHMEAALIHLAA